MNAMSISNYNYLMYQLITISSTTPSGISYQFDIHSKLGLPVKRE